MKIYLLFYLFILSAFYSVDLYASDEFICNKKKDIVVNYHIDYGNPIYKSVSTLKFPKKNHIFDGYTIKGLTDIEYKRSYDVKVSFKSTSNKACLFVESVDIYFGFSKIDVYIDEKYSFGTCEYSSIRKHENEHVKIYQNQLKKYAEKIGKIIYERVKEKDAKLVYDVSNFKREIYLYIDEVKNFIFSSPELNEIEGNMLSEIDRQNNILDSKESYDLTKKSCKNW